MNRAAAFASALVALFPASVVAADAVRVWEDTRTIPTYEEGPPDVNPPFDLFTTVRFNYPYTMRENLTDKRAPRAWRTLNLENEHLRVAVVPDLGGRLLSCVDKANGREMFYANPSIKLAQVAYRGAWATFGIEFNFPVSHNWVTMSPVDFATARREDGSASIVVGNVDLVYGMQWRVELTLRPGRAVLEQTTTLYNPSDLRHRFYWWTNAAVEAWDDSVLVYPMEFTATHGFTRVDTWPVDSTGADLSRPGNHRRGAVSLFSHGSREPFMGVYHPRTRAGVAHFSPPEDLPSKKVWSWGADAEGVDWRRALSDDMSAEVEIQAGLFRNQETYAFLSPQESLRFREYWMPVREIGAFARANPEAVLAVERAPEGGAALTVGLNVSTALEGGRLRIKTGERTVADEVFSLDPTGFFSKAYPVADAAAQYTVTVLDAAGRTLVEHTEGVYDTVERSEVKVGPQPRRAVPAPERRSDADFLELGTEQELNGKLLVAFATYEDGLRRFPESFELARAAGRLAVALKRYEEAETLLAAAQARVSNDPDVRYHLGCALLALGRADAARAQWEAAVHARATRPAALLQIARLLARERDLGGALERVRAALRGDPRMVRAGAMEVILLRRLGRLEEARARLLPWRGEDPTSATLRREAALLGEDDEAFWRHLAGDPQRVLGVAIDYMELGAWDDAFAVLSRVYPEGDGVFGEPGAVAPQGHPEVVYYRGYCREKLGLSGLADFTAASRLSTRYVFPHRPQSFAVLRAAIAANSDDATARFLLGSLYLSGGMAERALEHWEQARRLDPRIPVLHRNMGMTLLHALRQPERAREVLEEGLSSDPGNVEVYNALDQVLGLLGRPAEERVQALERFPARAAMPASLVLKLALALVEAGRFDEAEQIFAGRFFPREEFGTNVRQVWLEVRLQKALHLAARGERDAALALLSRLAEPVAGLAFTNDGMEAFVEGSRAQYLIGEAYARCGDAEAARRHWEKAAAGADAYPYPNAAYAYRAARRLRPEAAETERPRVQAALEAWVKRLEVGTSFPGANAVGQALLLRELGREEEARAKLRDALYLPDKLMSHYQSRAALREDAAERAAR